MKALILAAGQGKRLLPLTEDQPKAMLDVGGNSMIGWQIDALVAQGIDDIVVVTGFRSEVITKKLSALRERYRHCRIRAVFNTFYGVADNLVSCWMARHEMNEPFVLLNGDTLFHEDVLQRLLDSPASPVTLAVDHKPHYDEDDMKIRLDGQRLLEIGKTLPADRVDGESIGMLLFRGDGPRLFTEALDQCMQATDALRQWYLSVIGALATSTTVATQSINGLGWCEIDYPLDLVRAEQMVAGWRNDGNGVPISVVAS